MEHGFAKNACARAEALGFPLAVVSAADQFILLQEERHRADYDPDARYTRAQTLQIIQDAETAVRALQATSRRDLRAFAVLLTMKRR